LTEAFWDFLSKIKGSMHDYRSFDLMAQKIYPGKDGSHLITIQFQGTNAFGGVVTNYGFGIVRPGSNLATVIGQDEAVKCMIENEIEGRK
jgi:hypothetical protein